MFAALRHSDQIAQGHRRFAGPGRADQKGAGAAVEAAAEHLVQFRRHAADFLLTEGSRMLGGDKPREYVQPASPDHIIMVAATESDAAHLADAQAPPLRPIAERYLLQCD